MVLKICRMGTEFQLRMEAVIQEVGLLFCFLFDLVGMYHKQVNRRKYNKECLIHLKASKKKKQRKNIKVGQ